MKKIISSFLFIIYIHNELQSCSNSWNVSGVLHFGNIYFCIWPPGGIDMSKNWEKNINIIIPVHTLHAQWIANYQGTTFQSCWFLNPSRRDKNIFPAHTHQFWGKWSRKINFWGWFDPPAWKKIQRQTPPILWCFPISVTHEFGCLWLWRTNKQRHSDLLLVGLLVLVPVGLQDSYS